MLSCWTVYNLVWKSASVAEALTMGQALRQHFPTELDCRTECSSQAFACSRSPSAWPPVGPSPSPNSSPTCWLDLVGQSSAAYTRQTLLHTISKANTLQQSKKYISNLSSTSQTQITPTHLFTTQAKHLSITVSLLHQSFPIELPLVRGNITIIGSQSWSYIRAITNLLRDHTIWQITHHLRALSTTTPLSIEKLSVGSPAIFQARIFIGSPRIWLSWKPWLHGMPLLYHSKQQVANTPKSHIVQFIMYTHTHTHTHTSSADQAAVKGLGIPVASHQWFTLEAIDHNPAWSWVIRPQLKSCSPYGHQRLQLQQSISMEATRTKLFKPPVSFQANVVTLAGFCTAPINNSVTNIKFYFITPCSQYILVWPQS